MNRKLPLTSIDHNPRLPHTMIGDRAFESLRQAIVQLKLRPGSPLSEAEISRHYGVSRQPVREALIKLKEMGLVEIRPQRGTFIRLISKREVRNARFLREAIEVAIIRKAATDASDADIVNLEKIIDSQRVRSGEDDMDFLRLDEAFHQLVAKSADCEDAWRVLDSLKAQMDRVRFLSLSDATPVTILIEQHSRMAEAIALRRPDDAEAAMREHLSEILKSLPKLETRFPAFFTE